MATLSEPEAAARERAQVRTALLLVAAAAWIMLLAEPHGTALVTHCAATGHPAPLALGWVVMLVAMMAPMLIAPVLHVRSGSLARRRATSVAIFIAGYVAVWMAAGAILMALALATRLAFPESFVPLALASGMALVWQFSSARQRFLNRGHVHPELAAFGWSADLGSLRFGLTHGLWCVGSCWALMLLPLLVTRGHMGVMAAVTLWLWAERLELPTLQRTWRSIQTIGGAYRDETRHPGI